MLVAEAAAGEVAMTFRAGPCDRGWRALPRGPAPALAPARVRAAALDRLDQVIRGIRETCATGEIRYGDEHKLSRDATE